jgi:hypothetical protein
LDFLAEARWAAMCAVLKEDCLELLGEIGYENKILQARYVNQKIVN